MNIPNTEPQTRNEIIAAKLDQIEQFDNDIEALRKANNGRLLHWRYPSNPGWTEAPLDEDKRRIIELTNRRNLVTDELDAILKTPVPREATP